MNGEFKMPECEHTVQNGARFMTVSAGGVPTCIFCERDRLRAENERLRQMLKPLTPREVEAALGDLKSVIVAEVEKAVGPMQAERDALLVRRDELLATIARISQTVPLESEVAEALEQRGKLLAEIGTLRARCEELEAAALGAVTATAATHVSDPELGGHIEISEQCVDYLEREATDSGDPSGKLRDFVASLRIVLDQLDRNARRCAWFECAYTSGKQKLIEHATDGLSKQLARMQPVHDAALTWNTCNQIVRDYQSTCPLCRDANVCCDAHMQYANALRDAADRLDAALAPPTPFVDDESRCAVCQWPLAENVEDGCVRGNCSMRPPPERYYAPERAKRELVAMVRGVPHEERNDAPVSFASGPLAACTCTPTAHGHLTSCPKWRA